jgi:hypothetical protein
MNFYGMYPWFLWFSRSQIVGVLFFLFGLKEELLFFSKNILLQPRCTERRANEKESSLNVSVHIMNNK